MLKFDDYLTEELKNPAFKAEWDALEPEFAIADALIEARKSLNLTQKEFSAKTHISQADISKLESGSANPSLKTLKRIARGMNSRIRIEFEPADKY